jgi:hypothetical protein
MHKHDTYRDGITVKCKDCGKTLGKVNGMGPQAKAEDPFYKRWFIGARTWLMQLTPFARFAKDASDQHDEDYLAGKNGKDRLAADEKWFDTLFEKALLIKNEKKKNRMFIKARIGYALIRKDGNESFNYVGCNGTNGTRPVRPLPKLEVKWDGMVD